MFNESPPPPPPFCTWALAQSSLMVNGAEASMCSEVLQVVGEGKGQGRQVRGTGGRRASLRC